MPELLTHFVGCGIHFQRLTEHYIEMVRRWRLKPEIASKMQFRGDISPEMQKNGFKALIMTKIFIFWPIMTIFLLG